MQGFLRYGDSIVLYGSHSIRQQGENSSRSRQISGFLCTKGFLNKNVTFQTIERPLEAPDYKLNSISNFRDFVFKVTPKLKYEFTKAYNRSLDEFKKLKQGFRGLSQKEKQQKASLLE